MEGGERKALKYRTREQAEQGKQQLCHELDRYVAASVGPTIGEALAEYEVAMVRERGRLASSARHACPRLARFLPTDEALTALTAARAEALYRQESERLRPDGQPLAVATHQLILKLARSFFAWCVEKGYVRQNPFAQVRKLGRPSTGKLQLTADEAKRFLDAALRRADAGDGGALAVALQLALGLRSGEVLGRRVRDVDEQGSVLVITAGKTKNARRRLRIPDFLRGRLAAALQGRPADALLFGDHGQDNSRSTYLRRKVRELCGLAGVPVVCPHSLRGLHATLALQRGISSQAVAEALGHGSFAITARHYADPAAVAEVRMQSVLRALSPSESSPESPSERGRERSLEALSQSLRAALGGSELAALIALLQRPQSA